MWFQQPDAFTLVQFRLECGPDLLLKWFERMDLYYKTHEVTRCKQPLYIFSFTFMHLEDAFIQSDLHCIQVTVLHFISSCFPWESNP